MADEPNKKMDRLLRDYAGERRKSTGVSLHPGTRKMLHGEVARTYRRESDASFWSKVRSFWPQLAFGSGLATILVIAVLSLRTPSRKQESAASAPMQEMERVQQPQESPEHKSQPSDLAAFDKLLVTAPASLADKAESAPAPPAAAEPPSAPTLETRQRFTRGAGALSESIAQTNPAKIKAAIAENLTRANELTNLGGAMRVRFVELPHRVRRDAARPQLLTSFQLEQSGDDVRLHDADGSIYSGQLFPPVPQEQSNSTVLLFAPAATLGLTQNVAEHLFRVEGTNRALGKQVVVEGRYLERTNSVPSPENTFSFATTNERAKAAPETNQARFRRAIIGRAVVGQTNQIPVNAVSVEP